MTTEKKISGKKIVLIGGAGFIGHNLALKLVKYGAEVHVIDGLQVNNLLQFAASDNGIVHRHLYLQMINERLDLLRKTDIHLHMQDAREYHDLSHTLAKIKPDVIIHLAAISHAGRSNKDPYSTFDHSLRTLENALDCARDTVGQFIYLSSSMAYGNFQTPEVEEEHPLNPIGIYGALKLAGEKIVIAYQQVFNLSYTIIRPSALYGPRCVSRRVGQIFIENALMGEKLKVEGDGNEKLDFTYIEDFAEGVCLTIDQPAAKNQVFNLTYGQSRSIKDLVKVIQNHFPKVEIDYIARDKLMPFRGTLNVDKAKKLLGYSPQHPIEVGFSQYIDWYQTLFHSNTRIQTGV